MNTDVVARRRSWWLIAAGVLLLLSAGAHGILGWKQLSAELGASNSGIDLIAALGAGWQYGTMAMIVFGIAALIGGLDVVRAGRGVHTILLVAGGGYVVFGAAAIVRMQDAFFALFVVTGLLLAIGAALERRRFATS